MRHLMVTRCCVLCICGAEGGAPKGSHIYGRNVYHKTGAASAATVILCKTGAAEVIALGGDCVGECSTSKFCALRATAGLAVQLQWEWPRVGMRAETQILCLAITFDPP